MHNLVDVFKLPCQVYNYSIVVHLFTILPSYVINRYVVSGNNPATLHLNTSYAALRVTSWIDFIQWGPSLLYLGIHLVASWHQCGSNVWPLSSRASSGCCLTELLLHHVHFLFILLSHLIFWLISFSASVTHSQNNGFPDVSFTWYDQNKLLFLMENELVK